VWEREIIANCMILLGKKHYIASVWDSEGVRYKGHPKYKVIGMESKKSSTPAWSRTWLVEMYKLALNGTEEEVQSRYEAIKQEFALLPLKDVSIPTGINDLNDYADPSTVYKKGAPFHVKAALYFNKLIEDYNLRSITPIASGNKIRVVLLKEPNPIKADAIAYIDKLPPEFNLEKYIDREAIFEKSFAKPLRSVLQTIGWNEEKTLTLDSFF